MPHGYQDYGPGAPVSTVYSIQDIAELAARLGSPVTFDRRGNVIFLEDFEGSLAKCRCDYSANGSIAISSKYCRGGCFSCEMTTGPLVNNYARIQIPLAYPVLSKIGFEVCWNRSDDGALSNIVFALDLYDGSNRWLPKVRWVKTTYTWQYWSDAGDWVSLTPLAYYYEDDLPFNHTKLVVDFVNNEYVRLISNDKAYDLGGLALQSLVAAVNPRLIPSVLTYTGLTVAAVNYIDSVIITQNEP